MSTTNPTTGADIVDISGGTAPAASVGAGATGAAVPANAELVGGGAAGGAGNLTAATVKAASTAAVATDTALVVQELIRNVQMAIAAAGTQLVGIVGNAGAAVDGAIGAAPPANALQIGAKAATANPSNATGGNAVAIMADHAGRLVVTPSHMREQVGIQTTTIAASTAETTIITAVASTFCDLVALIITTTDAAAAVITIKDATGGTTRMTLNYPNAAAAPGAPIVINFPVPVPQAVVNNNWTATVSVNAGEVRITAVFIKNT